MTESVPEFSAPISAPDAESMFSAPDHTKSRSIPPGIKKAVGRLGSNKKARGGPRQLRPEDIERIADYYDMFAWAMQTYKPAVADAIRDEITIKSIDGDEESSETTTRALACAQAWGELAKENDSVRRLILMMVETGAWSKVMMVNLPILVAALPDDALSRLMSRIMPTPTADDTAEEWRAA